MVKRDEKMKLKNKKSVRRSAIALIFAATLLISTVMSGCSSNITSHLDFLINGDSNDIYEQMNKGEETSVKESSTQVTEPTDQLIENVQIPKPESQKQDGDRVTSAGRPFNTVTEVYYAVADSVVEITTETVQTSSWMVQYVSTGAGSGVIIDESGLILTNNHVIDGASNVTVRLTDGSEYSAKLVGTDSVGDIAVIKINPGDKELTVASFGCSADLEVGEDVIAIGNPLGSLGGTLTTGIISAKERTITIDGEEMVLLQTNAAINPGNSGGGLFNMAGQLIGIVNAKAAGDDVEGLGFAIPSDVAYIIINDLINYGYVKGVVDHGLIILDVTAQNLASAYRRYGITSTGIIILESRYSTDLRYGDKIITVDGKDVDSSSNLNTLMKSYSVGDTVVLGILRDNTVIEVELTLHEKVPDTVTFD